MLESHGRGLQKGVPLLICYFATKHSLATIRGPRVCWWVFLGLSERYKLYLWGLTFSLLIGFDLVEQFNCEFLSFWCLVQEGCIKYINWFTNSGSILVFLGSSESFETYLLGSNFSLLIGCFIVEQFKCRFLISWAGGVHQWSNTSIASQALAHFWFIWKL